MSRYTEALNSIEQMLFSRSEGIARPIVLHVMDNVITIDEAYHKNLRKNIIAELTPADLSKGLTQKQWGTIRGKLMIFIKEGILK